MIPTLFLLALDPALADPMLAQKLRSNRELALSSIEEVISKYANIQDDAEEEERRKRLGKEKQKKEVKRERTMSLRIDHKIRSCLCHP